MAMKGCWVFVLLVVAAEVACPISNTPASGRQEDHGCTDGVSPVNNHGYWTFTDPAPSFSGQHWTPLSRVSLKRGQLSDVLVQWKNSLSSVEGLIDNLPRKDCGEIALLSKGPVDSGLYTIYPRSSDGNASSAPLRVFCRMEDGQAWTVIQRRQDGSVDFYNRTWEGYSRGFGDLTGEFWLGNDNIHVLTNQGRYKLQIYLKRFEGMEWYTFPEPEGYSRHDSFRVEDRKSKYKLHLGAYRGPRSNWVLGRVHSDGKFFTNKTSCYCLHPRSACDQFKMGPFWGNRCNAVNPNGYYYNVTECPEGSSHQVPGISGYKFIEMRVSEEK